MKILICGSRDITDPTLVERAVEESGFKVTEIISGGAKGVDSLAEAYAAANRLPVSIFKPDWKKYGKRAGIVRNLEMVKQCDAVIAIWDGASKGTKSSIDFAKKENKPLYVVKIPTETKQ